MLLVGMAIGYILLTAAFYGNVFNGRNLVFMSTSLFGSDGSVYNQSAILTPSFDLDPSKLAQVGAPSAFFFFSLFRTDADMIGYTTTYAISSLAYNLGLGAAITHVFLWNWKELKEGLYHFESCRFISIDFSRKLSIRGIQIHAFWSGHR